MKPRKNKTIQGSTRLGETLQKKYTWTVNSNHQENPTTNKPPPRVDNLRGAMIWTRDVSNGGGPTLGPQETREKIVVPQPPRAEKTNMGGRTGKKHCIKKNSSTPGPGRSGEAKYLITS